MGKTSNEYNDNLFRLAAMLYKDENYDSSRENIIRKIIESIFLEDNSKKTVFEIIEICRLHYKLTITEDEIENVIYSNTDKFIIKREGLVNNLKTCLTEKRIQALKEHESLWIEDYIDEFLKVNVYDEKINGKEVLYKFLYEVFTSNYKSYQYFLNKENVEGDFSIDLKNYNEEEKRIINDFLNFDDENKDKAIFDIVSLSLEYCILTGDSKQVYVQGIRNKVFYLDSNIIYRAIGINGESRKELTLRFLEKCISNNIKLAISKYSEKEFKDSIEYHLKRIGRYKHRNINSDIYNKYSHGYDIYTFYYEWCSGRSNRDMTFFKAHINNLYSELLDRFKIEVDFTEYFKDDDEELIEIISSITSFKGEASNIILEYDAKNILALKRLRHRTNDSNKKLLETKYYVISTDQALREWDYRVNFNKTPLILLPSQWLAIMLRFVGRTSDDYKSFISFLNLRQNGDSLDSEKLHAILSGISELTEDLNYQKRYAAEIIELKAEDIVSMEDPYKIYEETKIYVKDDLENTLKYAQNEIIIAEEQLSATKKDIEINYISKEAHNEEVDKARNERDLYRNQLIDKEVKEELDKWSRKGYLGLFVAFLLLLWGISHFAWKDSKYNFVSGKVIPYIEKLPDISKQLFITLDALISLTFPGVSLKFSYNRLYRESEKYIKKREELRQEKTKRFD